MLYVYGMALWLQTFKCMITFIYMISLHLVYLMVYIYKCQYEFLQSKLSLATHFQGPKFQDGLL